MRPNEEAVILSAVRTAVGKFQGALSEISATQLGATVVREAVKRAGLKPEQIDECIMGNVLPAGLGQNPARQAAIFGGLANEVSALTINKVCGSGLKAVALAAQAIQTGNSSIVVAGGMESMTNAPYLLPNARKGYRLGNGQLIDSMINDGLWDIYNNYHMGITGENVAEKHGITREQQDEFALNSHRKAIAAIKEGRFDSQIVPVELPAKKKGEAPTLFTKDESPREDATIEALRALKPAFKKDGTVTAGNAPGVNDGAAASARRDEGTRPRPQQGQRQRRSRRHRPPHRSQRRPSTDHPALCNGSSQREARDRRPMPRRWKCGCDGGGTVATLSAERMQLGRRLAILAVQQIAHRSPPSLIRFTHIFALIGVHSPLSCRGRFIGGAALRAAVGETGFIRFQLELFCAGDADFYGESHLSSINITLMIRRSSRSEKCGETLILPEDHQPY